MNAADDDRDDTPLEAIDFVLGEGEPGARTAFVRKAAEDPVAARQLADTAAFVTACREQRAAPSAEFATRLAQRIDAALPRVVRRPRWRGWWFVAGAAAGVAAWFAAAWLAAAPTPPALRGTTAAIDPRSTLALLRVGHEMRGDSRRRIDALRENGGAAAVDRRAQDLADELAVQLPVVLAGDHAAIDDVSFGLRALIAAGAWSRPRSAALERGGEWIVDRIAEFEGRDLVMALVPLVEIAAATGRHIEFVRAHGQRLVDDTAAPPCDGRDPARDWFAGDAPAIADGGRLLALLPGFGVDAVACRTARQRLLDELRRQIGVAAGSESVAALAFGCGDLLNGAERERVDREMERWTVAGLSPDYTTVRNFAWSCAPGDRGFARVQRELRSLTSVDAADLRDRAVLCLCLTTSYAAWPVATLTHGRDLR